SAEGPAPAVRPEPEPRSSVERDRAPVVSEVLEPAPAEPKAREGEAASTAIPAVAVSGLTKTFGQTKAVDRVGMSIPAGSFYGLVGPNGAGKTTMLSMIG